MRAKFKVGDIVSVNDRYLTEGEKYFGKELKHKRFIGKIIKVYENTNDEKDGSGEVWQNVYTFKNDLSICEKFLQMA